KTIFFLFYHNCKDFYPATTHQGAIFAILRNITPPPPPPPPSLINCTSLLSTQS
ncbi:hypothetical protein HDE76_001732, partial [Rhodanobacter sp. ANJX3]|nr:hypothetical protein [Rhodanobacter sp. ANJX3]